MTTSAEVPMEALLSVVDNIQAQLDRLRGLLQPQLSGIGDPKDARNKLPDGKLTERGVQVCYQMFEAGMTRYAVAEAMGISYGAATHRLETWKKSGAYDRPKMSID